MGVSRFAAAGLTLLSLLGTPSLVFSLEAPYQHAEVPAVAIPHVAADGTDYSTLAAMAAKLPAKRDIEQEPRGPRSYPVNTNANTKRAGATRVMIAGDSMTQGKEGDWTWRYRMWQWAQANNLNWDFVGPYTGTRNPPETLPPQPPPLFGSKTPDGGIIATGGYAAGVDPNFDHDHYAIWGRALAADDSEISDMVSAHPPDIMLVMLGFNDLGWFYSDDVGLLNNLKIFLYKARQAKPDIKFAVANVPQRTFLNRPDLVEKTTNYNKMLADNIASFSTDQSPVYLVHLQENYNCGQSGCPVGYDGLHPNAMGEYQIAQAFSKTLVNDMKIGSSVLSIPANVPSRPVPVPSNFKVVTSPQGFTATWDPVYGAYGYNVRTKIDGYTDWALGHTDMYRYDPQWPLDGYTYSVQVQTSCGDGCAGDWTAVGSAKAVPQTAAAPKNHKVSSTDNSITISFDGAVGDNSGSVTQYDVSYWDQTQPCAFVLGAGFKSSPAVLTNMVKGHKYFLAISSWNANGEGFPEVLKEVIVGGGTPGVPSGLKIVSNDPTTAHLEWSPVDGAAGYTIWTRNVNNASDISRPQNFTKDVACADEGLLFPGVWNYEFCVQAFNGDNIGSKGACLTAPSPTSGVSAPSCTPSARVSTGCGFDIPSFTDPPNTTLPPTGGPTTTPIHAHPDPTSSSKPPTTTGVLDGYKTHNCKEQIVIQAPKDEPQDLWDGLNTTLAWSDATGYWVSDNNKRGVQFTEDLAIFFEVTTDTWKCQTFDYGPSPSCRQFISCDQASYPAGWVIMNSIASLESILAAIADVMDRAQTDLSNQASSIIKTFGNLPKTDAAYKIITDILNLGFTLATLPGVGDAIKGLNEVKEDLGDNIAKIRDIAQSITNQAKAAVQPSDPTGALVSETFSLQVNIAGIVKAWHAALQNYNTKLFDGTPESITNIYHAIFGGELFQGGGAISTDNLKAYMERAMFPLLIEAAWNLGDSPSFIQDSGLKCGDKVPIEMYVGDPKAQGVCVNGKQYFIGTCHGNDAYLYYGSGNSYRNNFVAPPGLSALDGKAWGGATKEDFVIGSVNSFNANGGKNGGVNPDNFDANTFFDHTEPLQIAGLLNLPVCSGDEAFNNWRKQSQGKSKNYPCN